MLQLHDLIRSDTTSSHGQGPQVGALRSKIRGSAGEQSGGQMEAYPLPESDPVLLVALRVSWCSVVGFPRCGDACHGGAAMLVVNSPVLEQNMGMGDINHWKILLVRFYHGRCLLSSHVSRVSVVIGLKVMV